MSDVHPQLCVGAALLWVVAALVTVRMRSDRRGAALWCLTFAGVPLLGWLTLCWGPTAGLAVFLLGGAILAGPLRRLDDT